MKPKPSNPMLRTRLGLASCLAALFAVSATVSFGQATNGASADNPSSADNAAVTSDSSTTQNDQGVKTLSPYEVTSTKDYGYLKTNSSTATRIGMEIQKVPMNISVISQEFIQDTNLQNLNDVYKYMASASGDSQFASDRPGNNPTPQGHDSLRGFPVNIILRNGVFLYSANALNQSDFADRIEVIKGPAAVFFGQGYPGGVVNVITKRAELHDLPTTLRYTFGSNNKNHMLLDTNQVLSKKAALRVVSGWENSQGSQNFEYDKRFDMDTSLVLMPFASGKVKITAEVLYNKERSNDAGKYAFIFPAKYFQDYNNPSAALIAAAGVSTADEFRAKINTNLGAWRDAMRIATGDPNAPLYTSIERGASYTDANGNYIHDKSFNFNNRGSYIDNEQTTTNFTLEAHPFNWLDIRYNYTKDNTTFNDIEGYWYPNADQIHYRLAGGNGAGYYRKTDTHQLDLVFKFNTGSLHHKVLAGYLFDKYLQQYWAPATNTTPLYWQIPGYNDPTYAAANPDRPILPGGLGEGWNVPANQVIRDRYGNIKTPEQVYQDWDPGTEIQPPADKLYPINRNLLDAYPQQDNAWYVNYQLSALNDRLTVLAGFRQETYRGSGQALTANFPWFSPPPYAFADTVTYPPGVYNYSPSYAGDPSNFLKQSGNSWMAGVSYEVKKDINVYATWSQTFHYNGNILLGGYDQVLFPALAQQFIDAYQAAGKPFIYKFNDGTSTTITSVADAQAAVDKAGANQRAVNEKGLNKEIGLKTSLWDNKFVSTFSLFQADRKNRRTEDIQHQTIDAFNTNHNPITDASGSLTDADGKYYNPSGTAGGARRFRWYSNAAHDRTQGFEAEAIITPIRNFQSMTNFSWMWKAKTLSDPSVVPGNPNYNIYFNSRLESAPKFRFNSFNKYTFTDGPIRGLDVGLGVRYSSKAVISRSVDWNPLEGGLQGGDYVVFDFIIGYPYEIFGYKLKSQLGIYNLTDKVYTDGWYALAPPRTWTLSTTLTF